tara:strand:+ start:425 stop:970 length:546 start_codon:yes stop_codon:yes gene_type:complete
MKFLSLLLIMSFASCGILEKPDWSKVAEPDGKKRAQQNVRDGKGIKWLGGSQNKGGGNFLFASSNPLWRASLEVVDFMGLSNVDYAGGLIITDWYSDNNPNESIKITLKFLSNEVRVDAVQVDIRKRNCNSSNSCLTKKVESDLDFMIKDKILKKAAVYKVELDKQIQKNRPKKVFAGDNE